ncbi:hypothetical protein GCM10022235_68620 [Kribbella ginsengisoli]|uniref:Uncharacterized protein n=1 Tax=Kribbella ginsengisoli TaxID=363865 RepID=A0ABP6YT36_9ACTN
MEQGLLRYPLRSGTGSTHPPAYGRRPSRWRWQMSYGDNRNKRDQEDRDRRDREEQERRARDEQDRRDRDEKR